ncbi:MULTISPECIES: MFS transporter [unclassified Corynebacterium]|uniref:MFS transporter n=1 Tax=unclassified Corynebacterium TaxID=2624378 RepID=UPI0029CA88AE|nr:MULTISPECIES: MFS transporter [unclassified Corynebacterium]WPF65800.1 MFS transporter [Corynebacterium sp. 22KM0430]WPF68293.1 MFS transporter [Corynebacterium sp. 21KM1197]
MNLWLGEVAAAMRVLKRIWPFLLAQVFTSAGVGLNLTVAALAAAAVTGNDSLGGLAQTSTIIGATLITALSTALTRARRRLVALRCSLGLAVIGSLLCGLAVSASDALQWTLFVGLFLLGGGTVSALLSRFAAADKVTDPAHASTAISAVLFGSAIGSAVGPQAYGWIMRLTDSPMPLVFLCSAAIFALGLIPLLREKTSAPADSPYRGGAGKAPLRWRPAYTSIFLIGVFSHATMVSLMAMAPLHTDKEFGPSGTSLIMTAHLLGMYALGPVVSVAIRKLGFPVVLCAGATVFGASYLALIFAPGSLPVFVAGLFGVGFGWSIGMISASTLAATIADSHHRITLQGRLDMSINIAAGLSSIVSGIAVAQWGYSALAASNALLLLGVLGTAAVLWRKRHLSKPYFAPF